VSLVLEERRDRRTYPIPTAEMNVPKNANVRITPKFLKKFSCMSAIDSLESFAKVDQCDEVGQEAEERSKVTRGRVWVRGARGITGGRVNWKGRKGRRRRGQRRRTCLSSYPEFKMIGGSNKLKNRVCLNDYTSALSPDSQLQLGHR
jgi:hypothetical protein